jgi:prepilin-type N-terminal cleavage/methylation domain-containing protein
MHQRGFTLVEVIVAIAVVGTAALATAQLLSLTTHAMRHARAQSSTAALATARMEQLCALAWTFDASGNPQSDYSTDLSTSAPASGGSGLTPSPAGALDTSTAGLVDFLDDRGEWIGNAVVPPRGAVFVRRWSVDIAAGGAPDTLVLRVLVRRVADDRGMNGAATRGANGESRFVTIRWRTAR